MEECKRPYVSLADIENEPMTTYYELYGRESAVEENVTSREFSLLAPLWYEAVQSGCSFAPGTQSNAFSPDPEGGKYRYSPDLDMTRFYLLIPSISNLHCSFV